MRINSSHSKLPRKKHAVTDMLLTKIKMSAVVAVGAVNLHQPLKHSPEQETAKTLRIE
jgi:hypothetical protein